MPGGGVAAVRPAIERDDVRAESGVPALVAEVSKAARRPAAARAMILDIDGTLAPIAASPRFANVPPDVLASLHDLSGHGWRIAILTGRPAAEARAMVPIPGIEVHGCHGLEREGGGVPRRWRALAARLGRIGDHARGLVSDFPGVVIERKPIGLAFHDRRLTAAGRARWLRALSLWLASQDLTGAEVIGGKRITELRPARAGKAGIAPRLLRAGRMDRSVVVIGDDRTDEELFEALGGRALTIRVGPPGVRSAAIRRLASPSAVSRFLFALAEQNRVRAAG